MNGQGLLDFVKTPEGQGLLGGLFGYASQAQRGAPINSLGRGGLAGLLAYGNADNMQFKRQEEAQQRQLRDMQLTKARTELADDQWMRDNAPKFYSPGAPAVGQLDGALPAQFQTGAVPMPAQAPKFDVQGFAQARMAQNPVKGMEMLTALQKDNPLGKIDPKDYTPDSLAKFMTSKNPAELVAVRANQVAPNGQVYNPYGVQPGTVFADPNKPFAVGANGQPTPNTPFQQFEITKAGASAPRVNVNTDKSYFGNIAEGLAKNDVATIEAARSAPERVASARRVKETLAQNPITGTGAEARLAFNKAFATAGLIDGTNVADTETLASNLASQTLDAIKTSGLGAGQGFTDKDRQFLERAKSGNIEMNAESLRRLADLNERQALSTIKRGNAVIGKLRMNPKAGEMGQMLDPIEEPAPPSMVRRPTGGPAKPAQQPGPGVRFLGFE